jgi:predicted component of type VI protein secretion system
MNGSQTDAASKRTPMDHDESLQRVIESIRRDIVLADARLSEGFYYAHFPLCVIDAVFSVNVRYESVINTVHRFAARAGWPSVYRAYGSRHTTVRDPKTINDLLQEFEKLGESEDAGTVLFGNRGVANPASRNPIPKARVVRLVAEVLAAHEVQTFQDYQDFPAAEDLDAAINAVPTLSSGIVASYLRMLAGDESSIKPDRMLHRYVKQAVGDPKKVFSSTDVKRLFQEAAQTLSSETRLSHVTPRLLDHEVWKVQRSRESSVRGEGARTTPARLTALGNRGRKEPIASGTRLLNKLEKDLFWEMCRRGGVTRTGLHYGVDDQGRLTIRSERSKARLYRILERTVTEYHGWFSGVYDHLLQDSSLDTVPEASDRTAASSAESTEQSFRESARWLMKLHNETRKFSIPPDLARKLAVSLGVALNERGLLPVGVRVELVIENRQSGVGFTGEEGILHSEALARWLEKRGEHSYHADVREGRLHFWGFIPAPPESDAHSTLSR